MSVLRTAIRKMEREARFWDRLEAMSQEEFVEDMVRSTPRGDHPWQCEYCGYVEWTQTPPPRVLSFIESWPTQIAALVDDAPCPAACRKCGAIMGDWYDLGDA